MSARPPLAVAAALALAALTTHAAAGQPDPTPPVCAVPPQLEAIGVPLTRSAGRIEQKETLTIVALGSSSTKGFGASAPDLSYPSQLAANLKRRFPHVAIRVINRGKGGEDAAQMVARIGRDVAAAHPDLVIWQFGTNYVLRHDDVAGERMPIERGLAALKATGADIILMDVQYAPRILARPGFAAMEAMIADEAARAHIGLLRRFAMMRHWWADRGAGLPAMVGPDGLHMSDAGYSCLSADLAAALAANWQAQRSVAGGGPNSAAAATNGRRHVATAAPPGRP